MRSRSRCLKVRAAAGFVIAALAWLTTGCRDEPRRVDDAPDVPVFLISIDTLRADRLPVYGYGRGVTPAIDRFRSDAILFERAYAHVPLTLPSHASLLTGQLPPEHGVRDNIGYVLNEPAPTLPSLLRARGYVTGAAVSTWVLRRETGIAAGFDFFDDAMDPPRNSSRRSEERDGERTRQALVEWISGQSTRRVFGLLHLFEPHAPYEPPSPYDAATDPYDGEVSYADAIVGKFLDDLRGRGLYDEALIILLSDHGEGLGDHGEDEHGVFLYRESINVPLIVKLPHGRRAGATVEAPAALIDVVPTVLAEIGVVPDGGLPGTVLTQASVRTRAIYAESYYPRLHLGWRELFAMIDPGFHYIDAPRAELYAAGDVSQKVNLIEVDRRAAFRLREELSAVDRKFAPPGSVDPEDRKRLAALGYVGSTPGSHSTLPDPKDHIESIRMLKTALGSLQAGRWDDALRGSEELLASNPGMVDGWLLKAECLRRLGQTDRAFATLSKGLRRFPTHPDLLLLATEVLLELNRLDEAKAHGELLRRIDDTDAREMLARIAIQSGDLEEASRQLEPLMHLPSARTSTLLLYAEILKRKERFEDELRMIDRALEQLQRRRADPPERLHYERGMALLELRRPVEAERAFREEISHFPRNAEAWGMLAVALTLEGKSSEAREVLREVQRENPSPETSRIVSEVLELLDQHGRK